MSTASTRRIGLARRTLLLLALVCALVVLARRGLSPYLSGLGAPGSSDLIAYWCAGRVLVHGGNPYDPQAILAAEQTQGWREAEPLLIWNPPWAMAVNLAFSALPFRVAVPLWLFLQLGLILACGVLLWRYFAPGDRRYWISLALAATFVPGLYSLNIGQLGGLLPLGVVGFLYGERGRRDALAGAALALLMIKPQIAYLFLLAVAVWVFSTRRWRVLVGWCGTVIVATAVAWLFSPSLLADYLQFGRHALGTTEEITKPLLQWATPTLGTWLRLVFGLDRMWLQFLPMAVSTLLLLLCLARSRRLWSWAAAASPLLLASSFTTPFGWLADQLVLLTVAVDLVSRVRGAWRARQALLLGGLAAAQVALFVGLAKNVSEGFHVWYVVVLAVLYWSATRRMRGGHEQQRRTRDSLQMAPSHQQLLGNKRTQKDG